MTISTDTITSALEINYTDVDTICAYQLRLCKLYERLGGFSIPRRVSQQLRALEKEGLIWLENVRHTISTIFTTTSPPHPTLADIPRLISGYDIIHRIIHGEPCYKYIRQVKQQTATRWAAGDHSISQTDLAIMLLQEVDRNINSLEERYTAFCVSTLGTWIDELTRYGHFLNCPPTETRTRLQYILNADLSMYLGTDQTSLKRRWAEKYALLIQKPKSTR